MIPNQMRNMNAWADHRVTNLCVFLAYNPMLGGPISLGEHRRGRKRERHTHGETDHKSQCSKESCVWAHLTRSSGGGIFVDANDFGRCGCLSQSVRNGEVRGIITSNCVNVPNRLPEAPNTVPKRPSVIVGFCASRCRTCEVDRRVCVRIGWRECEVCLEGYRARSEEFLHRT